MDSENSRIPAVVVGTGFGCQVHVPAMRAAGFEVVALVGTDAQRLADRAARCGVPETFTDLGQAIAKTGARLVSISTPPNTHMGLAIKALEAGCHVVSEKPMALTVGEAQAMVDAAERTGLLHLIGHELRFQPDRVLIGRALAAGQIGEPRFVTMVRYIPYVADPGSIGKTPPLWWFDKAAGGGWLGASGSHMIDQIRMWLGDFHSVSAALPIVSDRKDVAEDSLIIRFRLKNGVEGMLQETAGAWGPRSSIFRIAGTRGTLIAENSTVSLADRDGCRELPLTEDLKAAPAQSHAAEPAGRVPIELAPYTCLYEATRALIDGNPVRTLVPLPTFRDGLACMRVLDAVRLSARHGGALVEVG